MAAYENWRFEVEYTADAWTDLTTRVDSWETPMITTVGDTAEASGDTGGFTVVLQNHDQAFTPNNPLSSQALATGMRARITETIGYQTFAIASGMIDFPEIEAWAESDETSPRSQTITVPVIDRIAQESDGDVFISALAEHVLYSGGDDLVAYWPLTDESAPYLGVGPVLDPIVIDKTISGTCAAAADAEPQAGEAPAASEGNGIRCEALTLNGGNGYAFAIATLPADVTIPHGNADSLTIVGWYSSRESPSLSQDVLTFTVEGSGATSIFVAIHRDTTTGVWSVEVTGTKTLAATTIGAVGLEQLLPIAVRVNISANTLEVWVGGQRVTATLAGGAMTGLELTQVRWGFRIGYDLSHWQIYAGTTWGRTEFLEQIAQAHAPLDKQWTGERIRTIARYAGITELGRVDRGTVRMQPATLTDRTAADLWAEAVETEQGRLWADGAGQLVFQDKRTVHNV